MESVLMEEVIVDINRVAEPAWAPSPVSPASPASKTEAEIEADPEAEAE
jgi:hypothetical protein